MTFKDALMACLRYKLFNLRDRATRSEYWWFMLFAFLLQQVVGLLVVLPFGVLLALAVTLYVGWAQIAVTVRRLHDLNHSGKWLFLAYVPAFAGVALLFSAGGLDPETLKSLEQGDMEGNKDLVLASYLTMFGFVLSFAIMLYCAKRGTIGPNRFGPDPLQMQQQGATSMGAGSMGSGYGPFGGSKNGAGLNGSDAEPRYPEDANNPLAQYFKETQMGQYTQKDNGDFGFNANAPEEAPKDKGEQK